MLYEAHVKTSIGMIGVAGSHTDRLLRNAR